MKLAIALVLCAQAFGQSLNAPPKVLRIVREQIREGRAAAHESNEAAIVRAFSRGKWPVNFIGLAAVTGPSETWLLEVHDSFSAIDEGLRFGNAQARSEYESLEAKEGEYRESSQIVLASLRPDLSFQPEAFARSLPKGRYLSIGIMRIQPGREREFADVARSVAGAYDGAKGQWPYVIYQVVSGMPAPTYITIAVLPSLQYFDNAGERTRLLREAVGDERIREMNTRLGEALAQNENLLFAIRPAMSYVLKSFAAADPDFWVQPR